MTMTTFDLDLDVSSIEFCLEILLKLKQWNGRFALSDECFGDRLWTKDVAFRLQNLTKWSDDLGLILEAKATLQSLEGVSRMLADLSKSLDTSKSAFKSAFLPFWHGKGLDSLPDDVLAMIFSHVDACSFFDDRHKLTLVCRRFYRIAWNTPQLWCSVSNRLRKGRVIKHLAKSGVTGLDIYLGIDDSYALFDPVEMLDIILPHSSRWEDVNISFGRTECKVDGVLTYLREKCENADLTRLQSLSISFPESFVRALSVLDGGIFFEEPPSSLYFFESWKFTALRDFYVGNLIPNSFVAPTLRSLWIQLYGEGYGERSPAKIVRFLSGFPQLEDLRLTLGEGMRDENVPPVTLPKLEIYRLEALHCLWGSVKKINDALLLPSMRKFHITIEQRTDDDHPGLRIWFETLFTRNEYPELEELVIKTVDASYNREYSIPFEKFPNLRELSLDTPGWFPCFWSFDDKNHIFPDIRVLSVNGVYDEWHGWFEAVWRIIQEQKRTGRDSFKELRIYTPTTTDVKLVQELYAGKCIVQERSMYSEPSSFA